MLAVPTQDGALNVLLTAHRRPRVCVSTDHSQSQSQTAGCTPWCGGWLGGWGLHAPGAPRWGHGAQAWRLHG